MTLPTESFETQFQNYFQRPVAETAAKSLSNGIEIELQIAEPDSTAPLETLTFTKAGGKNKILAGPSQSPHIVFEITPLAAQAILSETSDDIARVGIHIFKLIASKDPQSRVRVRIKAGLMTFLTHGYLGVLTSGGSAIASYLATKGLGGMGAIKDALKKMKE